MDNQKKPIKKKPRASKYDEKLHVKGSFMDIMNAVVKDAKNRLAKKKD